MPVIKHLSPLGLLLFLTLPVGAADLNVPGEYATIQEAIDAASDGDVVLIAPGTYDGALNTLDKAITVRGTGGAAVTRLTTSSGSDPVMTVGVASGPVTLDRLTFFQPTTEALAVATGSEVVVNGCVFFGCSYSALISGEDVTLTIMGCDFISNYAPLVLAGGSLSLENSGFRSAGGRCIELAGVTATVDNIHNENNPT